MNSIELQERYDVSLLVPPGGVGIELGVAEGVFSEKVLQRSALSFLYSVDAYAGDRGHNDDEYRRALTKLMPHRSRNTILRMRFDEAVKLFVDHTFDFVYIDGYAHTGQEQGRTLDEWWPKAKSGAIFAGDDYCTSWPLTLQVVDEFVARKGVDLHVIENLNPDSPWSQHPTWWVVKP